MVASFGGVVLTLACRSLFAARARPGSYDPKYTGGPAISIGSVVGKKKRPEESMPGPGERRVVGLDAAAECVCVTLACLLLLVLPLLAPQFSAAKPAPLRNPRPLPRLPTWHRQVHSRRGRTEPSVAVAVVCRPTICCFDVLMVPSHMVEGECGSVRVANPSDKRVSAALCSLPLPQCLRDLGTLSTDPPMPR